MYIEKGAFVVVQVALGLSLKWNAQQKFPASQRHATYDNANRGIRDKTWASIAKMGQWTGNQPRTEKCHFIPLFSWPCAPRTEYFRILLKRVGIDREFINLDDASDLEYIAKNLAPKSSVEGYVVPVNDVGGGPASPTVAFTLPG